MGDRMVIKLLRGVVVFLFGGFAYGLLEVLWRGYTHISMVITGGGCFFVLLRMFRKIPARCFFKRFILSAAVITTAEFITGVLVNKMLKLGVWDYSRIFLNCMGQICLPFTILWGFLGAGLGCLTPFMNRHFDRIG